MTEEIRTLIKLVVVALFAIAVAVRDYRVVKADEADYRERRYLA